MSVHVRRLRFAPFFLFYFVLFFFFMRLAFRDKFYCSCTIYALFTYLKILKMSSTVLFIYLKIILLQCFQFLVFNFSKNKLYPNGPLVHQKILKSLEVEPCYYEHKVEFSVILN